MTNLLRETEELLKSNDKSLTDIHWVGTRDGKFVCTFKDFIDYAQDLEYDDGYGGAEINTYLVIVGNDWWLERGEYDGSEWWEFKTVPEQVDVPKFLTLKRIKGNNHWKEDEENN